VSHVITWFVHNPVAANLLMLVLVAGGLMSLPMIPQEEFPSIDTDLVRVSIEYPGAAPEEVEASVCIRVEEEIEGTTDIDRITSLAVEGNCIVTIELVIGSDTDAALAEIDNLVNGIDTFPDEAEQPVISKVMMRSPVLQLAISGQTDERTLRVLGQRARDEIAQLPGVSQVSLGYSRPYEISIEVPEEHLRRFGLTIQTIANAIRASSLDLPGGSVKTEGGEILLRSIGQAYHGPEFGEIVVLTRQDGTSVRLDEIAIVRDGFEDIDLRARLNGVPAVVIKVERVGDEDILEIADQVYGWAEGYRPTVPEGIDVTVFDDQSTDLVARLDALLRNARSGLLLVVAVLALFLRFRLAMWVVAGVPISLLGALMFFPALDITISTLTVMAFILVLGILVDDAIVIGESVHTHEQSSETQIEAAIRGTQEVYVPVFFGVLTSVAAFIPLILVPGRMGSFFAVIGVTAILCLAFSLVESQLILPAHLAHRRTRSRRGRPNAFVARWTRFQGAMSDGLTELARVHYGRALARAIEWRYVTAAIAVGIVILTGALFSSGRMRYQFFPSVDGDIVYATLTMPQGIPLATTEKAVGQLQEAAEALRAELAESHPGEVFIVHTFSSIGRQLARDGPRDLRPETGGAHLGEVALELLPAMEREIDTMTIADRWRELTPPIPDAVALAFTTQAFAAGAAIDIQLRGADLDSLVQAASALRTKLATYRGVKDIADSFRAGKQELELSLRPEARPLGLTHRDLARQVRQAFYGEEVQRIQRGRDDVKVMVRYPELDRRSLGALEEMRIRTADGTEVPFAAVANARLGRGFATIRRTDRMRVVSVTADVDRIVTTPERVLADLRKDIPALLAPYPGVEFVFEGEQREHGRAIAGLVRGALLALMLIYTLLAIPLKSYAQPLVIMSVIPFGAVGAILGHLIMGWDLVFFSVLGIVALSGVVVNASLVMVHYINTRRDRGLPYLEAVREAGIMRFRPIVLTSLTTYLGLVPLMFEAAVPAQPLVPMAIALGYGVLFASTVTLFLVPCGYVILDDLFGLLRARGRESEAVDGLRTRPVGD
jgi:multidrug efflux pump subunit AcrB